ncbi:MAG: hypothetical protein QM708_04620 [Propioniciclava sp.]|uniref:hypothetical protein n=1 Tax=Propioniciclava sp. TaxID=2038686 RepID=UPI0039E23CA6
MASWYRDHPYVQRYGPVAALPVYAPMFAVGAVLFLIGAVIMPFVAVFASRDTVAEGAAGTPLVVVWNRSDNRGADLLIASSTPVEPRAVTCTARGADGTPYRFGPEPVTKPAFSLDGVSWQPVATIRFLDSGDSVTCTGAGLGELRVIADKSTMHGVLAVMLAVGTVVSVLMTLIGFAMRRRVARDPGRRQA